MSVKSIVYTAIFSLGALAATSASAQEALSQSELRVRQEALFDALLDDPDNLDLMFDHALTSIALADYEAAISTLERMLIYNPGLGRAKVELGAAYYRLGAYENARFYFEDALENDDPPPEVIGRINSFLDEIARRTARSGVTGVAAVGITYSSNANLGPGDGDVLLRGLPATLQDDFVEEPDFGLRTVLSGSHYYDLNQPDGDIWRTDLTIFNLHYFDETAGDIDSLVLRTGPRLSVTEESFGPKVRPFLEIDGLRSDNDALYASVGGGVEYSDTLTERTNISLIARSAYRDYFNDRDDFDGSTHRVAAAVVHAIDDRTRVNGLVYFETDQTEADENTNYEFGARFGATHRYDSGFDFADRPWSLSGYGQVAYRVFDEPNPLVDPNETREDLDLRMGVSHVFQFTDGWFAQADADLLLRDSNLPNFELDNVGVTFSVGKSF